MASRLQLIRQAVEVHVVAAISGVTISNDVVALDLIPAQEFPHARLLFAEEEPERLDFKQERRRVIGEVFIGVIDSTPDKEAGREIVDGYMETIRDAIFGDETLSGTVDDISCEAGSAFSGREDDKVYGTLDIATEEVF
jgi:hypothetical protein